MEMLINSIIPMKALKYTCQCRASITRYPKRTPERKQRGRKMAAWADEITLISLKEGEERVNHNGFPN